MARYSIETNFTYHAPRENQIPRYELLRELAKGLGKQFLALCPDSRERSLALTKLEEAVMWANAAIAREPEIPAPPPNHSHGDAVDAVKTEILHL